MYGETQEAFAARLGIPFKRWNQYERGYPIPRETAWLIRQKIANNISDWVWFGDEKYLDPDFKARIKAAQDAEQDRARFKAKALQDRRKKAAGALRKRKPKKRAAG